MVEAACRVTPSGKQNSFAAHQLPSLIWIEVRDENLPVSYANAFCNPVKTRTSQGVERESAQALKEECETLTRMYDLKARTRLLLSKDPTFQMNGVSSRANLKDILAALKAVVLNA